MYLNTQMHIYKHAPRNTYVCTYTEREWERLHCWIPTPGFSSYLHRDNSRSLFFQMSSRNQSCFSLGNWQQHIVYVLFFLKYFYLSLGNFMPCILIIFIPEHFVFFKYWTIRSDRTRREERLSEMNLLMRRNFKAGAVMS